MKVEAQEVEGRKVYSVRAFNDGVASYLSKLPDNPINGKSAIKMIPNGTAMPAPDAAEADTYGWIYKPQTQELIANLTGNDSTGTPYSRY